MYMSMDVDYNKPDNRRMINETCCLTPYIFEWSWMICTYSLPSIKWIWHKTGTNCQLAICWHFALTDFENNIQSCPLSSFWANALSKWGLLPMNLVARHDKFLAPYVWLKIWSQFMIDRLEFTFITHGLKLAHI